MNLNDLFHRDPEPKPWEEGEKIPWNDPDFNRRMLKEHLSQKHDAASRRTRTIKKQVDWIHNFVLDGKPSIPKDLKTRLTIPELTPKRALKTITDATALVTMGRK